MDKWTINQDIFRSYICLDGVRLESEDVVSLNNKMDKTEALQDELIAAMRKEITRLKLIIEHGLGPKDLEDDH